MIKVISANDSSVFYINHKKIETIKLIGSTVHVTLDNGKTFIVSNNIEDIKSKIIEFESLIINSITD